MQNLYGVLLDTGFTCLEGQGQMLVYRMLYATKFFLVGSKNSMQMLEGEFVDGDWTPFNTTGDEQDDNASDNPQAKDDTTPPSKKVCRQKLGKENSHQQSSGIDQTVHLVVTTTYVLTCVLLCVAGKKTSTPTSQLKKKKPKGKLVL